MEDSTIKGSFLPEFVATESELLTTKKKVEELQNEKKLLEDDFGRKRAIFMDMFKQKEDAVDQCKQTLEDTRKENESLKEQYDKIKTELDDFRTANALAEQSREEELNEIRRQAQEEVDSLTQLIRDPYRLNNSSSPVHSTEPNRGDTSQEAERIPYDHKQRVLPEKNNFLSSVAKSIQKKVSVSTVGLEHEHENLEESYKKAQADAELLKSVVMPLEAEIKMLKEDLEKTNQKYNLLQSQQKPTDYDSASLASQNEDLNSEEKVKELNHHLKSEKSSRTDLEMYVAVLNTQKSVLQDESDNLQRQLNEVCKILEISKKDYHDLTVTWKIDCDRFKESNSLLSKDLQQVESLLNEQQQQQVSEYKTQDEDRKAGQSRLAELELAAGEHKLRVESEAKTRRLSLSSPEKSESALLSEASPSKNSISSMIFDNIMKFNESSASPDKSYHPVDTSGAESCPNLSHAKEADEDAENKVSQNSLKDDSGSSHSHLTEQDSSTSDLKKESVTNLSVKNSAQDLNTVPSPSTARRLASRGCDMCRNYESQLQAAQTSDKKLQEQTKALGRQLLNEQQNLASLRDYVARLEETLSTRADELQKQLSESNDKAENFRVELLNSQENFTAIRTELTSQLENMCEERRQIQSEIDKLEAENQNLVGKHSKTAGEMQDEMINFPNNFEEMQLLLLQSRENEIAAKVSKEYTEETMRSEILFLKDRVMSEQQEHKTLEEALSQEITQLQQQLTSLQNTKADYERLLVAKTEIESKLKENESVLRNGQLKSRHTISTLQAQLDEQTKLRQSGDANVQQLRTKISALQVDLDNSEAVQRDFVKLSQSLQIQLEKIRQAETEVRWQHEEDCDNCAACHQQFTVTRRKHHCRHCGRVFCADCLTKVVNSGRNMRPSRVCDVCHTMLVRDAQPYFSQETPPTPD